MLGNIVYNHCRVVNGQSHKEHRGGGRLYRKFLENEADEKQPKMRCIVQSVRSVTRPWGTNRNMG